MRIVFKIFDIQNCGDTNLPALCGTTGLKANVAPAHPTLLDLGRLCSVDCAPYVKPMHLGDRNAHGCQNDAASPASWKSL